MTPRYRMPLYRPPSEASSLLIQATYGCPHNDCTFCPMYKGVKFRARPVREVLEDIDEAALEYGRHVKTVFLPDGNTIVLSQRKLLEILERLMARFPSLERITCYGSAKYVVRKSVEELKELLEAGLKRLHMGMESGDPATLDLAGKGTTPEEIIEAGCRVRDAGIELSEYYIVGLGGEERAREHARGSARVLNAISPTFVRLRTLVPVPGTKLHEEVEAGSFVLPCVLDCLRELRLLISALECETELLSDHISNHVNLNGRLPDGKEALLEALDRCLECDEESFRGQAPWWLL